MPRGEGLVIDDDLSGYAGDCKGFSKRECPPPVEN
jgi:hypothetical protein